MPGRHRDWQKLTGIFPRRALRPTWRRTGQRCFASEACAQFGCRIDTSGLESGFLVHFDALRPWCPYITDPPPPLARPAHTLEFAGRPPTITFCCCDTSTSLLKVQSLLLWLFWRLLVLDSGQTHSLGPSEAPFAVSDPRTSPQELCQCMLTTKSTHR